MNKEQKSKCCNASMTVVNEDEGTCYYACDKCKLPTDAIIQMNKEVGKRCEKHLKEKR